jgi:hypothetical protein
VTTGTLTPRRVIRKAARVASPKWRRWKRLLSSLTLDPDLLPRPLTPPGPLDFLACGSPRAGTSLLCAALFQPPRCVVVMEPWDGMRMPPAELLADLRREVEEIGTLSRGRLDIEALRRDGSVRWMREGTSTFDVEAGPGLLLGVKWPAFWRYLDLLPATRFLVCLRHPYEVIASYRREGGRLAEGYDYSIPFNRRMNADIRAAVADRTIRRIALYDYINERLLPHLSRPNVLPVRYERWFSEPDRVLTEIGEFLGADLSSSPAVIRAPEGGAGLTDQEARLIRRHCRTAEPLGYRL